MKTPEDIINLIHDAREYMNGRDEQPADFGAAADALIEAREAIDEVLSVLANIAAIARRL